MGKIVHMSYTGSHYARRDFLVTLLLNTYLLILVPFLKKKKGYTRHFPPLCALYDRQCDYGCSSKLNVCVRCLLVAQLRDRFCSLNTFSLFVLRLVDVLLTLQGQT